MENKEPETITIPLAEFNMIVKAFGKNPIPPDDMRVENRTVSFVVTDKIFWAAMSCMWRGKRIGRRQGMIIGFVLGVLFTFFAVWITR